MMSAIRRRHISDRFPVMRCCDCFAKVMRMRILFVISMLGRCHAYLLPLIMPPAATPFYGEPAGVYGDDLFSMLTLMPPLSYRRKTSFRQGARFAITFGHFREAASRLLARSLAGITRCKVKDFMTHAADDDFSARRYSRGRACRSSPRVFAAR